MRQVYISTVLAFFLSFNLFGQIPSNLALFQPATQSTTDVGGVASRANDGDTNGEWSGGSISHTNGNDSDTQDWWQVDLGAIADIDFVNVWNRTDCCSERLTNFNIFISETPFASDEVDVLSNDNNVTQYTFIGTAGRPTVITTQGAKGRYVRFQLNDTSQPINLAELEVIGILSPTVSNLALFQPATQSTTDVGGVASRANDGDTNGEWSGGSISHTNGNDSDTQDWWQVDLGAIADIEYINVWNRTDCCADRLTDFNIFISNTPFTSDEVNVLSNDNNVTQYTFIGTAGRPTVITTQGTIGRYVRLQLNGTSEPINLAELEVFGIFTDQEECPEDIVQQSNLSITQDYSAIQTIESNGKVLIGHDVEYTASEYIEMTQNFEVEPSAVFHAFIEACISGNNSPDQVQARFYVSPNGDDSNIGSQSSPWLTLERARNHLRTINNNMSGNIIVYLRGGTYDRETVFSLEEQDSGTNGNNIIYQAFPGEEPILNGATKVTGWTQHSGNIYKATLDRSTKLRTLIVNDERAYMASKDISSRGGWGTYNITAGQADWAKISGSESDGVQYNLTDLPNLSNADDVEIMRNTTWNSNIVCVRETTIEGSRRILKLSQPYGAIAQKQNFSAGFNTNGSHTLFNAYEFLDSAGEFYFDKDINTIFYYKNGEDMSQVDAYAPHLSVLVDIAGTSTSNQVKNISFKGITFANTEAELPQVAGSSGKSTVQAATWKTEFSNGDWHPNKYQSYDVMPGAINVNNARFISFEDNVIKHIGNEGINYTNDVSNSQIVGNAFLDIGGSGINVSHPQHVYIGDGGDDMFSPSVEGKVMNVLIENNLLYDCTRLYFGHAAITGFFTDGLVIEHNQIQNTRYSGVSLGWGWWNFDEVFFPNNPTTTARNNKFNYNRVYNVMTLLHDGGAFYTLGSQPNSEANGNYVKAPTTNFQGVYHPDEGTAWYTGRDLVFEIVPGQDNFELNTWRRKHDNHYDNIFSTSSAFQIGAPNSTITNLQVYPNANWPTEALNIIDASGLEPSYLHLLDGIPDPPEVPGI